MFKKWVALFLTVVVLFAVLLYAGAAQFAGDVAAAPANCRIQGAWVSSFAGGPWDTPLLMLETISPQDPAGNKLTYTMHLVNPDATFAAPPLSESDYMSDLVGEAVRTGRDSYEFSLIGYGVEDREANRGRIIFIWTVTGTMTCVDGEHKTDEVHIAVYLADQDGDGDGFPDEGEEPFLCIGPGPLGVGRRVPQMEACVPTPMES